MSYRSPWPIALLSGAAILCGWLSPLAADPAPGHPFEKDIVAFEKADRATPPPRDAILFVGDSQFTRWKTIHQDLPGYTVINRGFGGSRMSDLLYYVDRVVLPYHPRMIVINEGGNDLHGGRTPEQLLADFQALVAKIHAAQPNTPILMSSLTPSPQRWSEAETRKRANQLLKDFIATQQHVQFVDLFNAYLGSDGKPQEDLFVADRLHHSEAGYQVRVRLTRPYLGPPDLGAK